MSVSISDLIMDYNYSYSHGKSNVIGCARVYSLANLAGSVFIYLFLSVTACSSFGG